jgi:hypothetical protein
VQDNNGETNLAITPPRARFPRDPAGGVKPPTLPRVEECTLFQGVKSSWGINRMKTKTFESRI